MVDHRSGNLRTVIGVSQVGQYHPPRVDNHAVAVAHPFLVMTSDLGWGQQTIQQAALAITTTSSAYLGGCDDIRLRLDGASPQQDFPVCLAGGHGEGGGVSDDIGPKPPQGDADLGESQLQGVRV